ncbi:DUF1003 domain-containing protein [Sulfurospirillum diekertiae]|uniref:DUF1003 domain-containing protein n=1 Tax=Sulfurospirillum diekertiae TaxID=1854492 RepID=A0A6G9VUP4_9BACT|nr:DUF1003 domain-containing protein [Sulfurospirillum diekertiae]QIR77112.1 DUF1003 domain-containing protein [Sulfurospirillum diekertiae]QIR79729.1 DUF1003 domain-containing protein [Sulfurospirillum diekertiae]
MKTKTFISDISGKSFPLTERISSKAIRGSILKYIQDANPTFNEQSYLANTELNIFREKYITDYLTQELGQLTTLEHKVIDSFQNHSILTDNIEDDDKTVLSFGQRIADKVATFGGSWTFILSFCSFLIIWILVNVYWFHNQGFDPYPYILLNLILSCIAALQAPVIMMSQNRQEEKDRIRAKNDYMINLKSELEIRMLHEKIDHLIMHQQEELLEIQKVQIDMMEDILQRVNQK